MGGGENRNLEEWIAEQLGYRLIRLRQVFHKTKQSNHHHQLETGRVSGHEENIGLPHFQQFFF